MFKIVISFFLLISLLSDIYSQNEWPLFRKDNSLSGYCECTIPDNPKVLWNNDLGEKTKSSPVVSDGVLFIGTGDGNIYSIDNQGNKKWKFSASNTIEAAPAIINKILYISTLDGNILKIDANTGKKIGEYITEGQVIGSVNWYFPKPGKHNILAGSYDFFLHCIDTERFTSVWKSEADNYINGTPACNNDFAFYGSCDAFLRVISLKDGKEVKKYDLEAYIASSPAIKGNIVYAANYNGKLFAVDYINHKTLWSFQNQGEQQPFLASPAIASNKIIIGNYDKNIYCIDAQSGKMIWKFLTAGKVEGSASVAKNKVIVGSRDGFVYIIDLNTGKQLWSFETGLPIISTPAIVNDKFYVVTENGRIYAFGN